MEDRNKKFKAARLLISASKFMDDSTEKRHLEYTGECPRPNNDSFRHLLHRGTLKKNLIHKKYKA